MKHLKRFSILIPLMILSSMIYQSCRPLLEMDRIPTFKSTAPYKIGETLYDPTKKTVVIIANNEGTEIFDLLAPFYLFSATQKANVFIVAPKKTPITLLKGVFALPNLTLKEIDSLKITPDVIVIPAMVKVFKEKNSKIQNWIKDNYKADTKILSVCAGSLVAAATGIYDGKILTFKKAKRSSKSQFG